MSTKIYFGFIKPLRATNPFRQRTIIGIKDRNISSPHRQKNASSRRGRADRTDNGLFWTYQIATGDQPPTDNALFWICQVIAGGQPAPVKNHFEPFWTHQAATRDHYGKSALLGEEPFWTDQIIARIFNYFLFDFPASLFENWDLSINSSLKYHIRTIKPLRMIYACRQKSFYADKDLFWIHQAIESDQPVPAKNHYRHQR